MSNRESSEELIRGAERYLYFLVEAYQKGDWNISVRTGQDVVELALKGLLKKIGIEYPKVHDVGRYVVEILERRKIELEEGVAEKIKEISAELTEKRAPAFYFEKRYGEADAARAKDGAEFVLNVVKELWRRL